MLEKPILPHPHAPKKSPLIFKKGDNEDVLKTCGAEYEVAEKRLRILGTDSVYKAKLRPKECHRP